jgi:predicted membrane protein
MPTEGVMGGSHVGFIIALPVLGVLMGVTAFSDRTVAITHQNRSA